jgi:hypothetical protein
MSRRKKTDVKENRADRILNEYRYGLSLDQQLFVEKNATRTDLLKLTQDCFQDISLDEHSDQFKSVKNFLVKYKKGIKATDLTDEQIEFIQNNGAVIRAIDIARQFYPNSDSNLAKESQTIAAVAKALGVPWEGDSITAEEVESDYEPPKTDFQVIEKMNKADINLKLHVTKLDSRKREWIAALKRNMHSPRFLAIANSIRRKKLRELYESEFVKATYDKPDLNAEETNMYITLCNEYVLDVTITEQINLLNDRLCESTVEDEDSRTFTMSLSNSLSAKTKESNECKRRITQLQQSLSGSRSERLKDIANLNESLTKFVELVQEENGRKKLLRLAEAKNLEIQEEIKRIDNFDELIAEVWGMSIEEIIKF